MAVSLLGTRTVWLDQTKNLFVYSFNVKLQTKKECPTFLEVRRVKGGGLSERREEFS